MKFQIGISAGKADEVAKAIAEGRELPEGCDKLVSPGAGAKSAFKYAGKHAFPKFDSEEFWREVSFFGNAVQPKTPKAFVGSEHPLLAQVSTTELPDSWMTPHRVGGSLIEPKSMGLDNVTAAGWVENDWPAQAGIQAVEYLIRSKGAKLKADYPDGTVPFVPHRFDVATHICAAVTDGCLAAWGLKWKTMAPRPVEVAEALRNKAIVAPAKWQDDAGVDWFTKHFMPRYNSTPRHPAWPSGHAVHGGVIATMLLALFEDGNPDVRAEAEKIELWLGFGRVIGGIHWLVDIQAGIEIGRQAAATYIKEHQL